MSRNKIWNHLKGNKARRCNSMTTTKFARKVIRAHAFFNPVTQCNCWYLMKCNWMGHYDLSQCILATVMNNKILPISLFTRWLNHIFTKQTGTIQMHNEAVQIIIILLTFAFWAFQPLFMNHPEIRADQPSAVLPCEAVNSECNATIRNDKCWHCETYHRCDWRMLLR